MSRKWLIALLLVPLLSLTMGVAAVVGVVVILSGADESSSSDPCASPAISLSYTGASGAVRVPATGSYIYNSPFGMRFHPIHHRMKMHAGMDMVTLPGPGPIVATTSGTVSQAVHGDPGAGNFVKIEHAGGVSSRYLHLSRIDVKAGQQVTTGQQIGVEGTTGNSTGAHLHFEIRQAGVPTDPAAWLASHGVKVATLKGGPATAPPPGAGAEGPAASVAPAALTGTPSGSSAPTGATALPAQVGAWRGTQIEIAAKIIKAVQDRGLDAHTQALAVMTAMSESSLAVLHHGDAARNDTVGPFQEGPERGPLSQRLDPAGATNIFLDHLLKKAPNYHDMAPTAAAHRAQGNADPMHYEPMWDDAVLMVATLTKDPDLLASLPASGAQTNCAADSGPLPGTPSYPPSGSPAEKGLAPNALNALRAVKAAFGKIQTIYGVGERSGPSDHGAGQAVDFMIEDYRTPEGRAYGWQVAKWAQAHHTELEVKYIIWDMKIWSTARADEGWRDYTAYGSTVADDTLAHRDHVHISVIAPK